MRVSGVGQPGHCGGYHAASMRKCIHRHCERSEAIHVSAQRKDGLLRFARNDGRAMDCFASLAMAKLNLRVRQNNPTGKSLPGFRNPCPAPRAKIFRFRRRANQWFESARLTQERGGSRSSRTLRWDAVDARATTDECGASGRRSRVVLAPRRWRQVGGKYPAGDGGKKARSPGRARYKP